MRLEPYREEHLEELMPLWRESFEHGLGITDPHPLADQRRHFLEKVLPFNEVRVAFIEGRMVGFVSATRESVTQLYVRRDCLRQGIGERLLGWAKEQSSGSLWLMAFERNTGARAFYERHGFAIAARGFEPFWQLADLRYEWRGAPGTPGKTGGEA